MHQVRVRTLGMKNGAKMSSLAAAISLLFFSRADFGNASKTSTFQQQLEYVLKV